MNVWVYYLAFAVIAILGIILYAFRYEYSIVDCGNINARRNKTIYFFTFVMIGYIVFWAAIRNGIVDTAEYIQSYELVNTSLSFKDVFFSKDDFESKAPLFLYYQIILRKLGFDFHFYLGSIAIISGLCVVYGISRFSDDVAFSCFLFVTTTEFYWMFNGIRQFLVVAVMFAAFRLIVEKKIFKFLVLVFLMYFIHKTAIIFIPIYFIANMKNWNYGIWACIFITIVMVLLFPGQIVTWIDSAFDDYNMVEIVQKDDGVNILRFLVSFVTPVIAFMYREQLTDINSRYIDVLINFSLITAGLYAVGVVTSGIYIGRLAIYTEIFSIILLPFILKRIVPIQYRTIVIVACVVLYFVYFHLQAQDGMYYTTDVFDKMNLKGI